MGLFYDRTETESEIVIQYKRFWPLIYVLIGLAVIVPIFTRSLLGPTFLDGDIFFWSVMAFVLVFIADTWSVQREMKAAMRSGHVRISGSKFSPTDPIRVVIPKGARGTEHAGVSRGAP